MAAFVLDASTILFLLVGVMLVGLLTGVTSYLLFGLILILAFVYYVSVAVWLTDGLTIGKAVCNLRVRRVRADASPRTPRALSWSVGRHSIGYVVVDVFGLGCLLSLVHPRSRCLHDLAFGSEVVVCWIDGEELSSPQLRLARFKEQVEAALDDLDRRYGWAFFLWRWLSRLVILPATVVLVVWPKIGVAVAAASMTAPSAAAGGATTLSTPVAAGLFTATVGLHGRRRRRSGAYGLA